MTAWEAFVANQRKLAGKDAAPKLVNIDLQPYQTVQACERADIMNIGGFSDAVVNVIQKKKKAWEKQCVPADPQPAIRR